MTRRPARRAAFTIIELLIVVVIIALLAALLLAGIARVKKYAVATQTTNDISLLETACTKFKDDWGFVPPTTFTVPAVKNSADPNFILLTKRYPRWMAASPDGTAIAPPLAYAGQTLNGNQSMVFFLGGPNNNGWMTDAPYDAAAADAKPGPYFDFKPDRLAAGTGFGLASAAPVFLDPYKNPPAAPNGTPYAYLGSTTGGKYPAVPCFGVNPFMESATKFVNQGTVQIVSAGEDGAFGPGGMFVAGSGVYVDTGVPNGADDIANFNGGSKLGVGK
jgi:prepilin-type N-terminal cleavage/methylation domain-containing protein